MTAQNPFFKRLSTLNNLPTLPHILLKLIAACNQDNQDLNEIGEIVNKDPALSAKILKLVNSAYFGLFRKVEAVSEAAVLVGTNGIKNMAICACVYDAFPKPQGNGTFSLKKFWWHSLRCAFLAKHMASVWDAGLPDEAFLAGLLHDIGKAVLWVNFTNTYEDLLEKSGDDRDLLLAGEAYMGATHAEVGAWLLVRWQFDPSIADCVRYHHEQPDRIAQAMAMVQIIHVANLLCQDTESDLNAGLVSAHQFFGRDPVECRVLMANSDQEAGDIARWLDIDVDLYDAAEARPEKNDQKVQDQLICEVKHLSLTLGTLEGFIRAQDLSSILRCIADGLNILFDIKRLLFFLIDETKNALVGYIPNKAGQYVKHHALAVSMKMNQSLLVKSLVDRHPMDSFPAASTGSLAIIDEQLIRLLGGNGMVCLPFVALEAPVGVLALGIDSDDLPHLQSNDTLLNVFIHKGALALRLENLRRRQLGMIQATRIDAATDLAKRVVHEVNNPLSIIKNYLKVLDMKMDQAGIDHDEIRIINEEITRAGHLLKRLTDFSSEASPKMRMTDINVLLADILTLTTDSLLSKADIHVHADFDPNLPAIAVDADGLKQVFINLIKNAAEAMAGRGGNLEIRTRHLSPALGGKRQQGGGDAAAFVEIVIRDDGPGIPEEIKEKLFDPYVSTKRGGHSGLGLSVVYNKIKSLQGTVVCESVPHHGTIFTIELPMK